MGKNMNQVKAEIIIYLNLIESRLQKEVIIKNDTIDICLDYYPKLNTITLEFSFSNSFGDLTKYAYNISNINNNIVTSFSNELLDFVGEIMEMKTSIYNDIAGNCFRNSTYIDHSRYISYEDDD